MQKFSPRILDWLAVAAVCIAAAAGFFTQSPQAAPAGPAQISAVRVEVQRYMGYEILPARYLSLPYDLVMNTNEQVALLYVGALLLMFVPVIMLLGFRGKLLLQWSVALPCLLLLVISVANGYVSGPNFEIVKSDAASLANYLQNTSYADAPAGVTVAWFYQICISVYGGIYAVLSAVSGDKDAFTYPLLLACFVFFAWLAGRRSEHKSLTERAFYAFVFVYVFFWLLLSSGIVWYGFLALPLLTLLMFKSMEGLQQSPGGRGLHKLALYGFFAAAALSVGFGYAQRLSNIKLNILPTDTYAGKRLYDPAFLRYYAGDFKEGEVIESFYPQLNKALPQMNSGHSLIYNVGTRFHFFITDNDERVFSDNQLDMFNQLMTKYPYKDQLIGMLKGAGFGYIMVDLNTPTGDRTPEQELAKRFNTFLSVLYENPFVELAATNRTVRQAVNGQPQEGFGVFGEIKNQGSYAVFKIK